MAEPVGLREMDLTPAAAADLERILHDPTIPRHKGKAVPRGEASTIHALLRARLGTRPYAIFWSVGEGRFMPNGEEEHSGYVLTKTECYFFWTRWGERWQRPGFTVWRRGEPKADWYGQPEFERARQAVGHE
jgi:hypothetical protein